MRNQFDLKSLLIGFLSAALLISTFSFKNETTSSPGRYQTSVGERGVAILDTQTGAYLLATDLTGYNWSKGEFENTFQAVKDNTRKR